MNNVSPELQERIERERRSLSRQRTNTLEQLQEAAERPNLPPPSDKTDPLLLPVEVRERVRLSQPTIDRMRRKGKFSEPLIIGERRIAWRASVIETWLAERDHAGSRAV
jgi:predicted DNA-binding transcriptional regulator AlpA